MPSKLVDTQEGLEILLNEISNRFPEKGLIFLDLEGVDLARHGSIAIMQMRLHHGRRRIQSM